MRGDTRTLTGLSDGIGVPDVAGIAWIGDTLYFGGSWEAERGTRWYAWTLHPERGFERIAWARGDGPQGPPEGVQAIQGKLYVYGALSDFAGVAVYDPADGTWSRIEGTYLGQPVVGNSARDGTGVVNDLAFDERTGDLYLVGNWAPTLEMPGVDAPARHRRRAAHRRERRVPPAGPRPQGRGPDQADQGHLRDRARHEHDAAGHLRRRHLRLLRSRADQPRPVRLQRRPLRPRGRATGARWARATSPT